MTKEKTEVSYSSIWQQPVMGSTLAVLSGLAFLVLCMLLPLVGPAAVHGSGSPGARPVPHLTANIITFLFILFISMALAGAALYSKLQRRKIDQSPFPYSSLALCLLLLLIFIAHLTGLLAI